MKRNAATDRKTRIMIVEDHPLARTGLRVCIEDQPDLIVCGEASDADEALRVLDSSKPDLIIIDLSLKGSSGLELIKRIKARNSVVKMLVSSMHDESLYAERVLSAGALGYVHKQEAMEKMIDAIRSILAGHVYLSEAMNDRLLQRLTTDQKAVGQSPVETLSDRELEVFEMIGRGCATRDIARQLHLSIKTVDTYREKIKQKLKLASAAELSKHAFQWVQDQ
jgi:DNA-binding NarL/FixJ family response regulator